MNQQTSPSDEKDGAVDEVDADRVNDDSLEADEADRLEQSMSVSDGDDEDYPGIT